jgi:hypothetical protein
MNATLHNLITAFRYILNIEYDEYDEYNEYNE